MKKKYVQFHSIISMALLFSNLLHPMLTKKDDPKEIIIDPQSLLIPSRLQPLTVTHDKKGFHVIQNNKKIRVQDYSLHKNLRGISQINLRKLLSNNFYLDIKQASDGEYLLDAKGRLEGGGPILGAVFYWTTKAACYGGLSIVIGATGLVVGKGSLIKNAQNNSPSGDGPTENMGDAVQEGGIASAAVTGILAQTGVAAAIESLSTYAGTVGLGIFSP